MKEIRITDIEGFRIGHYTDRENATGVTVIINEKGAMAGGDVRGGGPASKESELLKPMAAAQFIHSICLSGGSAYGLDATSGVMRFLEERGIGFDVGCGIVPLVVGASLFDLELVQGKIRPTAEYGYNACAADEAEAVKTLLVENMESAVSLAIPMRADLETAGNWYDL